MPSKKIEEKDINYYVGECSDNEEAEEEVKREEAKQKEAEAKAKAKAKAKEDDEREKQMKELKASVKGQIAPTNDQQEKKAQDHKEKTIQTPPSSPMPIKESQMPLMGGVPGV